MHTSEKGSEIAKKGFKREVEIVDIFNNIINNRNDIYMNQIIYMLDVRNFDINKLTEVSALAHSGQKYDLSVKIMYDGKEYNFFIQSKKSEAGFSQIDKRWVDKYKELWDIPNNIVETLNYFTGMTPPCYSNTRDSRRMFLDEIEDDKVNNLILWFDRNYHKVIGTIFGININPRVSHVIVSGSDVNDSVIVRVYKFIDLYSGPIIISPKGSLYIGKITMQRKGGDNGRKTANMLQFKINPKRAKDD